MSSTLTVIQLVLSCILAQSIISSVALPTRVIYQAVPIRHSSLDTQPALSLPSYKRALDLIDSNNWKRAVDQASDHNQRQYLIWKRGGGNRFDMIDSGAWNKRSLDLIDSGSSWNKRGLDLIDSGSGWNKRALNLIDGNGWNRWKKWNTNGRLDSIDSGSW